MPLTVFPSRCNIPLYFPLCNQTIALALSAGILWHVSCHVLEIQSKCEVVQRLLNNVRPFEFTTGREPKLIMLPNLTGEEDYACKPVSR